MNGKVYKEKKGLEFTEENAECLEHGNWGTLDLQQLLPDLPSI